MQYRIDQHNGQRLSALGFGAMRFPTINGKIDYEKSIPLLHLAIDNGLNYIDTAYPYHKGQSETFIGCALKDGYREKVKLATKLPHWLLNSEEEFENMLDIQLSKLQTDVIDYYLIHMISNFEAWERLKKLGIESFIKKAKASGKIINMGFSSHMDLLEFKQVIDDYPWDFCQIQFNILDEHYQAGLEGLKYAAKKGLSVIVMEPLRGGMLANQVPKEVRELYASFPETYSPVAWALRWIWNHPEVTCVLSGMNLEEHILENINTSDLSLPNHMTVDELELINKVKLIYKSKLKIQCTGCRYCMPCPFGVNIPGSFELYNHKHIFTKSRLPRFEYVFRLGGAMGKKSWASLCKDCGKCEKVCPQHIEIRKELKEVKKAFEGPISHMVLMASKPIIKMTRFFSKFYIKRISKKYHIKNKRSK